MNGHKVLYLLSFFIFVSSADALNTNISFQPDVSETNNVSLNDIHIRFNISDTDIIDQIPDQVVVFVQVCYKFSTLYCYDVETYPAYWENFGTWQQTFLNPFNMSVNLNVFTINTSKDIIYLYGKIVSGYSYDPVIHEVSGKVIAQDIIILNFSNTTQPLPTLTPTAPTSDVYKLYNYTNNYTGGVNTTGWGSYSYNVVSSFNATVSNIFNIIDYPFSGLRSGIQSVNSSLNNSTYNLSMSFLVVVVPPIISAIPNKIKALITLYLVFLIILIILGKT